MFDKELLIEIIDKNLKNREELLNQLHEMNAYTEEEDLKFAEKTKKIEELKDDITKTDYISKNDYLLLAADFDNYKKRVNKSEQSVHDKAYKYVILAFLRIYDDLERINNKLEDRDIEQKMFESYQPDPIYSGIQISFENFEKTLISLGCEKIDCCKGDLFDVNIMEAISTRLTKPDEYLKPDEVADIYQTGWKYNGKVIRPVKVIVAK